MATDATALLAKRARFDGSYDETSRLRGTWKARPGWGRTRGAVVGLRRLPSQAALLRDNATLEDAVIFFRSDNCAGQFKSGRHFRFISEWSMNDMAKETCLIWSHFEDKHGKDMSDWECGRHKWLLFCQEMRHTKDAPTWMRTSEEACAVVSIVIVIVDNETAVTFFYLPVGM